MTARMTARLTHQGTLPPVTCRIDWPRHTDWTRGLLAALALVAVIAWRQADDDAAAARESARIAQQAIADRDAAPPTASVVLVPKTEGGFQCRAFHVRAEWSLAIGHKCAELAALIQTARTTP